MKRVSQAIVAALGLSVAGSAFAYFRDGSYFDYARVQRVDRLLATTEVPRTRQECWNEPRSEYHPGADYRRETIVPSDDADVIDENGIDDAGFADVERADVVEHDGYATTTSQRVCQTRTEQAEAREVVGYDVVYRYRGEDYHERLDHDPGRSVRVRVDHGYVEVAE